jgi:hypothetical protein
VVEKVVRLNFVVNDVIENVAHMKVEDVYDGIMTEVLMVMVIFLLDFVLH